MVVSDHWAGAGVRVYLVVSKPDAVPDDRHPLRSGADREIGRAGQIGLRGLATEDRPDRGLGEVDRGLGTHDVDAAVRGIVDERYVAEFRPDSPEDYLFQPRLLQRHPGGEHAISCQP